MIKKLQIKFVCIIMALMSLVLLAILATINITMERSTTAETRQLLQRIADSDGHMSMKGGGKPPEAGQQPYDDGQGWQKKELVPQRNFSVKLDADGQITEIISDRNQSYTTQEVAQLITLALGTHSQYGTVNDLNYFITPKPYGQIVVFLDNSMQSSATLRLFWITCFVALASLVVMFFISIWLSAWAIRPVKKAYEAQRQFVADASHELKTPLTVIGANLDVLSQQVGENKWLGFIRAETLRMSQLVHNLLFLAKSDAAEQPYNFTDFDLSAAVLGAALPFESICFEQQKALQLEIASGIFMHGDEKRLVQLVGILLDNAIKNAPSGAQLCLSLAKHNSQRVLTMYNTGDGIPPAALEKIFDRFYRSDVSRARQTGGYGLGLAIAKATVAAHGGKITAESSEGHWAKFTIIL